MPKKTKVNQGRIFAFVPDDEDDESELNLSILIQGELILALAQMIKDGDVKLTDKGQIQLGAKLYEPDGDSSYELSGPLWSKDVQKDDWEDLLDEYRLEEVTSSKRRSKSSESSSKSRRGTTRRYR